MRPALFEHPAFADYELVDSGAGEKLERFGEVTLIRPDPQALWHRRAGAEVWSGTDLRFVRESDRGGRWVAGERAHPAVRGGDPHWTLRVPSQGSDVPVVIRPTPFKHVGLFPEQACNWSWTAACRAAFEAHGDGDAAPRLLNLFGYTGVASVLAARSGFQVTHVDASKSALAWTRENVAAAGLGADSLRVVLDDALAFARRQVRRGARFEGILIDPPHYGRGPKGERWQFETGIAALLEACRELLAERSFLVLSTYAIGYSPLALVNLLSELEGGEVQAGELALPETSGGRMLPAGFCARWKRGLAGVERA